MPYPTRRVYSGPAVAGRLLHVSCIRAICASMHIAERGNKREACFIELENYQIYLELWQKLSSPSHY